MNKIRIFTTSMFAFAVSAAMALPSWVELSTKAYSEDSSPSTAKTSNYSAYYCTVEDAEALFGEGRTTASYITTYLSGENFTTGKAWFEENASKYASAIYGLGQYTFTSYGAAEDAAQDDSYISVVFYNDVAFRAFGTGSATLDSGNIIFDDEESAVGTYGDWTAVSVPEPTGGVLLLLGIATLALGRRRE